MKTKNALKPIFQRMDEMSAPARYILEKGLMLSCTLLFCAVLLKSFAMPMSPENYQIHMLAKSLWDMTLITFLEATLGCTFIEEYYCKNNGK